MLVERLHHRGGLKSFFHAFWLKETRGSLRGTDRSSQKSSYHWKRQCQGCYRENPETLLVPVGPLPSPATRLSRECGPGKKQTTRSSLYCSVSPCPVCTLLVLLASFSQQLHSCVLGNAIPPDGFCFFPLQIKARPFLEYGGCWGCWGCWGQGTLGSINPLIIPYRALVQGPALDCRDFGSHHGAHYQLWPASLASIPVVLFPGGAMTPG